jgi:hypothetical protein
MAYSTFVSRFHASAASILAWSSENSSAVSSE